jgi:hypothetical protein
MEHPELIFKLVLLVIGCTIVFGAFSYWASKQFCNDVRKVSIPQNTEYLDILKEQASLVKQQQMLLNKMSGTNTSLVEVYSAQAEQLEQMNRFLGDSHALVVAILERLEDLRKSLHEENKTTDTTGDADVS